MAYTASLETPDPATAQNIDLLDLLLVLAENAKCLLLVPLLVGLLVWAVGATRPLDFQSTAVLQTDPLIASWATTSTVLDPVARQMGLLPGESIEQARSRLQQRIDMTVGRDKLLTLRVTAATPVQAQQLAHGVLGQIYKTSQPKDALRKRLEAQLLDARAQLRDAQTVASSLGRYLTAPDAQSRDLPESGRAYADLLNISAAARSQIQNLEGALEGVTSAQLLQAPTVSTPSSPYVNKILPALGAALGTGLLLLLLIAMRNRWRNLSADTRNAEKVARIRRALGLT